MVPLMAMLVLTYLLPGKGNALGNQVVCNVVLCVIGVACSVMLMLGSECPEQPMKGLRAAVLHSFLRVSHA
jgi:hypothetical protein